MLYQDRISLWLQMFAEDEGAENQEGSENENEQREDDEEKNKDKNKGTAKYTDADLDRIINQKFAKWQKQKEEELAEAEKTAKMSAAEKQKHDMDKLAKENEELKAAQRRVELEKDAAKKLAENKLESSQDILDFVVGADENETDDNIKKLASIIDAAVKKSETARATGTAPRGTGDNKGLTEFEKRLAKYKS